MRTPKKHQSYPRPIKINNKRKWQQGQGNKYNKGDEEFKPVTDTAPQKNISSSSSRTTTTQYLVFLIKKTTMTPQKNRYKNRDDTRKRKKGTRQIGK